ncbi:hypothetical protein ACFX19_038589 [Malus domestica]
MSVCLGLNNYTNSTRLLHSLRRRIGLRLLPLLLQIFDRHQGLNAKHLPSSATEVSSPDSELATTLPFLFPT